MKETISKFSVGVLVALTWSGVAFSLELPAILFSDLKSEDFHKREKAQADLVEWARLQPEAAMEELFRQSRVADDPEIRERCLAALRELADDVYLKDGDGYIGVQMRDETVVVAGDDKPRGGIRVVAVVPGSAADRAGLRLNDLIVGLNDLVWREEPVSIPFGNEIRKHAPNSKVMLRVLRNGGLMDVEVTLGRRPDDRFLQQWPMDLGAADRAAREAHFRRLLERHKAAD